MKLKTVPHESKFKYTSCYDLLVCDDGVWFSRYYWINTITIFER